MSSITPDNPDNQHLTASNLDAVKGNYYFKYAEKLHDNGYDVVPIGPGVKYPQRYSTANREWKNLQKWDDLKIQAHVTQDWPDCGVGIVTGTVVAIDIDILDANVVHNVRRAVVDKLGETPLERIGLYPKRIMLYRTEKPFTKMKSGKIEVLAQGQQFVAFGIHPDTGETYKWVGDGSPDTVSVSDLPVVTEDQVRSLLNYLNGEILPSELRGNNIEKGQFHNPNRVVDNNRIVGTQQYITEAMSYIPNFNLSWDDWNRIGMNLFRASEGEHWGCELFEKFTNLSSKANGTESASERWESIRKSPPASCAGAATIYGRAQDHGWPHPPMHAHMYRDVPVVDEEFVNQWSTLGERKRAETFVPVQSQPIVQGGEGSDATLLAAHTNIEPPKAANINGPVPTGSTVVYLPRQAKKRGVLTLHDTQRPYKYEPGLVRDTIPRKGVGFLAGPSGSGKTFALAHLAVDIATGRPFAGREIERRGGVVIVPAEGAATIEVRLNAARSELPDPNQRLPIITLDGFGAILGEPDYDAFRDRLQEASAIFLKDFKVPLVAVIIDTVSAAGMVEDGQENDTGPWTKIFNHCNLISGEMDLAVVLVHHMGKNLDQGLRGSSNARAAADFSLALTCKRNEVTGENHGHMLALTKSRTSEEGPICRVSFKRHLVGKRDDDTDVTTQIIQFEVPSGVLATALLNRPQKKRGRPSASRSALDAAMNEVLISHGRLQHIHNDPSAPKVNAVPYEVLLAEYGKRADYSGEDDPKKRHSAMAKQLNRAIGNSLGDYVQYGVAGGRVVWRNTATPEEQSNFQHPSLEASTAAAA